jgi:hypothetical protein
MMRPLTVATGAAFAACVLDTASAFHVPGKAPLALATGRSAGLRSGATGLRAKVLTVGGKKLSKFEAMRFKAGRSGQQQAYLFCIAGAAAGAAAARVREGFPDCWELLSGLWREPRRASTRR